MVSWRQPASSYYNEHLCGGVEDWRDERAKSQRILLSILIEAEPTIWGWRSVPLAVEDEEFEFIEEDDRWCYALVSFVYGSSFFHFHEKKLSRNVERERSCERCGPFLQVCSSSQLIARNWVRESNRCSIWHVISLEESHQLRIKENLLSRPLADICIELGAQLCLPPPIWWLKRS